MKSNKGIIGVGLVTAIAASLCCITPVIALIAGTTGMASSFSWIEPFRPYLIIITIAALGYAWYKNLKPKKQDECGCEPEKASGFFQGKIFLGLITVFTALMLTFPMYSHIFYSSSNSSTEIAKPINSKKIEYKVTGMTCK